VAYIQANHLSGREKMPETRRRHADELSAAARRVEKNRRRRRGQCRRRGATGAERYQIS